MKNLNIKTGVLTFVISFGILTSCQQENDDLFIEEGLSSVEENTLLAKGFCSTTTFDPIDAISDTDYNAKISSKVDDRSCTFNYKQSSYGSKFKWGGYRLTNADNGDRLQTRMERSTTSVKYSSGKYLQLKGTVRILNAGSVTDNISDNSVNDQDGTYIAQVKGQHDKIQGDESPDPAIALFVVKPKRRDGGKGSIIKDSKGKVKEFKIYSEQVKKRGGSGSSGRRLVYITTVKRNTDFKVDIKTRFQTVSGTKRQYIDYTINGVSKSISVSVQNTALQTTNPKEMRIRMGAYRCRGGSAEILWKDDLTLSKN